MIKQTRQLYEMSRKSRAHKVHKVRGSDTRYEVISGNSGNAYKVRLNKKGASCTCDWGKRRWVAGDGRAVCSHVIAVYRKRAYSKGFQLDIFNSVRDARSVVKADKTARKLYVGDSVWLVLTKNPRAKKAKVR